jgi:CheY-like chemotaxis protein
VKSKSILIIDDDEISLLIAQNALEIEGYQVIATSDSLQVIQLIRQLKPTAVVLDIFMPGKDGFELIKDIKQMSKEVFIIAISSNDECLRAIKALGADVCFSKVNMPDALVDCIKMLCP